MPTIKNRERFFKCVEEGLQQYFDQCDRRFHGTIYFTVGVKKGKVGAIIRGNAPMSFAPKIDVGDGIAVSEPSRKRTSKPITIKH